MIKRFHNFYVMIVGMMLAKLYDLWFFVSDFYLIYLRRRHLKSIHENEGNLSKQHHQSKIAIVAIYPSDDSILFTKNLLDAFLDNGFYVLVLSTRVMTDFQKQIILERCHYLIERYNIGQDLGSYKHGLYWLEKNDKKLSSAELVVLANDSMFYAANFTNVVKTMTNNKESWQCLFENYQHCHHAQSFFLLFRKEMFQYVSLFWKRYKPSRSRFHAIYYGEIALSQYLAKKNFFPKAYYNSVTVHNALYQQILSEDRYHLPVTLFLMKCINKAVLKKKPSSFQRNVIITKLLDEISMLMHTHNPTHSVGLILAKFMSAPLKRDICYPGHYNPAYVVRNVITYHADELLAMENDLRKKSFINSMPMWRQLLAARSR